MTRASRAILSLNDTIEKLRRMRDQIMDDIEKKYAPEAFKHDASAVQAEERGSLPSPALDDEQDPERWDGMS